MWLRPEQLPHFVREARIESFSHFRPVASDSRPMRPGRSAFAARRSSSIRAFRSSGGNCGGRDARLRASRSRAAPIHSAFCSRKSKARFAAPRRGTKAARRPWRAPKSKCGGRARSARGSPRPAGDAHRGRSSHQHSIDRHSLYYNGRIRTFQLNIFEQNPATVIAVIQQPQQLLRRRLARFGRIESAPFQLAFQQIPTGNPVHGTLLPQNRRSVSLLTS